MRTRGVLIHSGFTCLSLRSTIGHQLFDFRNALHDAACKIFHIDSSPIRVFLKLELIVQVLFRVQEIPNVFIINLKVRNSNEKLHLAGASVWALVNEPKYMIKGIRDDTSVLRASIFNSHHCMCFSTPRLAIGKYCSVIAL